MFKMRIQISLLILINLFFTSLHLNAAELIFEVGGKFHVTHFYQIDSNYNFMTIKNTWTMTTNTPYVGYGNCSGTIKTKSQKLSDCFILQQVLFSCSILKHPLT